jgi:hypothetical protein
VQIGMAKSDDVTDVEPKWRVDNLLP